MTIMINILGIILIIFIIGWFWLANIQNKKTSEILYNTVDITVANGVYTPALIKIKRGEKVNLRFLRQDPSPCAEWVIFQNLDISQQLPVNQPRVIELLINDSGEYNFTCQMNMYRGKLIVVD